MMGSWYDVAFYLGSSRRPLTVSSHTALPREMATSSRSFRPGIRPVVPPQSLVCHKALRVRIQYGRTTTSDGLDAHGPEGLGWRPSNTAFISILVGVQCVGWYHVGGQSGHMHFRFHCNPGVDVDTGRTSPTISKLGPGRSSCFAVNDPSLHSLPPGLAIPLPRGPSAPSPTQTPPLLPRP